MASLCASLAPNMATSTRPLRVLWKREDATKVSVLLAIGVVVRVPAHKWAAGCPRHRRAARNGLRAPGSRGTASRRRRGGASCGAKRERKRRGSATLLTNARSEFCVDRHADGFLTRAVLARVLRTYLGSHRRPRRGVHWFARSLQSLISGWSKYYTVIIEY